MLVGDARHSDTPEAVSADAHGAIGVEALRENHRRCHESFMWRRY